MYSPVNSSYDSLNLTALGRTNEESRLSRDDADGETDLEIVALHGSVIDGIAGQDTADMHVLDACSDGDAVPEAIQLPAQGDTIARRCSSYSL